MFYRLPRKYDPEKVFMEMETMMKIGKPLMISNTRLESYCLERSLRLRLRRADSLWLIRVANGKFLFTRHWAPSAEYAENLNGDLREVIRQRYGNPFVVWFLMYIIVPIVVRLAIAWWLKEMATRYIVGEK
jgi:hypothetical protein